MSPSPKALASSAVALARSRKAAYLLPTMFTAGNIFLGFLALVKTIQGALQASGGDLGFNSHFELAAKCIGIAVVLDGLDGRIARMTNTVSDFGRELDSLADVITFGIAPSILAFFWGVQFVSLDGNAVGGNAELLQHLRQAGYFVAFLFVMCGSARLARFNIQTAPVPGKKKPDHRFFVGLPIPAAAGLVAALVYAGNSKPIVDPYLAMVWLTLVVVISLLMVSTWRYISFKDLTLLQPRKPLSLLGFGCLIWAIWNYSHPVLLAIACLYLLSGFVMKAGTLLRRFRKSEEKPDRDAQEPASV